MITRGLRSPLFISQFSVPEGNEKNSTSSALGEGVDFSFCLNYFLVLSVILRYL